MLILPRNARPAQPNPPKKIKCSDVIKACDKTIEAYEKDKKAKEVTIKDLAIQSETKQKELDQLRESSNSWYKNPVLWGVVGVLIGVLAEKH